MGELVAGVLSCPQSRGQNWPPGSRPGAGCRACSTTPWPNRSAGAGPEGEGMQRPIFTSQADYGPRLTDAQYWRPHVEEVCARHGLSPCRAIRAGMAGTFPTMIVDDGYAVKFYGDLF